MNHLQKSSILLALFAVSFLIISCGSGKVNTDPDQHQKFINASRNSGDVRISLDTVFFQGKHYCILKEEGVSMAPFYNFISLTGEPCIKVLPYSAKGDGTTHHEFSFLGQMEGNKAYDEFSFSTISVVETVVNNNLMSSTGLRPIDVGNFVKSNPMPPKFNPASYTINRDRALPISIKEGYSEIYQENTKIAKYERNAEKFFDNPDAKIFYHVKYLSGVDCAIITISGDKLKRKENLFLKVETEWDGKVHNLDLLEQNVNWDLDGFKQGLNFLVKNGYL